MTDMINIKAWTTCNFFNFEWGPIIGTSKLETKNW